MLGVIVLAAASCSSAGGQSTSPATADPANICEEVSAAVAERLDDFLHPFADVAVDDFFATGPPDGLVAFQTEVTTVLAQDDVPFNERCEGQDLDTALADQLSVSDQGSAVAEVVLRSLLSDREPSARDIVVRPGDDLPRILASLGAGSSLTFEEGIFELAESILIQDDVVMRGAGIDKTVIRSSAAEVGLAILAPARVRIESLTFEHQGDVPASLLLSLGAHVELQSVRVKNARSDEDGRGGVGVVLRDLTESSTEPASGSTSIIDSELLDNDIAGLVIGAAVAPMIRATLVAGNDGCGLCFFDAASGVVEASLIERNGIGVQISDSAQPTLTGNEILGNDLSGVSIDGASPLVSGNRIEANVQVGIEVAGGSNADIRGNVIGSHPVGLSLAGESHVIATENEFADSEVAIQLSGSAAPEITDSVITGSNVAVLLGEDAAGNIANVAVAVPAEGAGLLFTQRSRTTVDGVQITGGMLAISVTGDSTPTISDVAIVGSSVGVEVAGRAQPAISNLDVADNSVGGIVYGGSSAGELSDSAISAPGQIGIQIGDMSSPRITRLTITGGDTGMFVVGQSRPEIVESTFTGQAAAIEVADSAMPIIRENDLRDIAGVALSFNDDSGGSVIGNSIFDAQGVGIQIAGSATPDLDSNIVGGPAREAPQAPPATLVDQQQANGVGVGLLYAERSGGTATRNQIVGFGVGIQIGGASAPAIVDNTIDGGAAAGVGVLYGGTAAGEATGNRTLRHTIGFQIAESSSPVIRDNTVESASQAAFLSMGAATPTLTQNVCPSGRAGIATIEDAAPDIGENNCEVTGQ